MDAFGSGLNFSYMHLGTGTTTPAYTDTALSNFGVSISDVTAFNNGVSGASPHYGFSRLTWTSTVGGASGNWTEIGVSDGPTTGGLRSHALILDSFGSPTTFTVLPDEQFQGSYEVRFYAPTADVPASINLSGTPYTTVARALGVTYPNWWGPGLYNPQAEGIFTPNYGPFNTYTASPYDGGLAAVTAYVPLGSVVGSGISDRLGNTYTSGNFYKDSGIRYGSGVAVGTFSTISYPMAGGGFQINYSPAITKLTTEEVVTWVRVSWARR